MHTHTVFSTHASLVGGEGETAALHSARMFRSGALLLQVKHTAEDQLPKDGTHAAEIGVTESLNTKITWWVVGDLGLFGKQLNKIKSLLKKKIKKKMTHEKNESFTRILQMPRFFYGKVTQRFYTSAEVAVLH